MFQPGLIWRESSRLQNYRIIKLLTEPQLGIFFKMRWFIVGFIFDIVRVRYVLPIDSAWFIFSINWRLIFECPLIFFFLFNMRWFLFYFVIFIEPPFSRLLGQRNIRNGSITAIKHDNVQRFNNDNSTILHCVIQNARDRCTQNI